MKPIVHAIAGTLALIVVATFFLSTLVAEMFFDRATIAEVKRAIAYGIALLVPLMAMTGGTGHSLSRDRRGAAVERKKTRMRFIALNGLFILAPAAIYLHLKASANAFDGLFIGVQVLELVAGTVQLTLLGMNFRDGMTLGRRVKRSAVLNHPSAT